MADEKKKKQEPKPWERDVFGVGKAKPAPTPTPTVKKAKPKNVTDEASEIHADLTKRNKELKKLYGEKSMKKGSKRKDSKRR